MVKNADSGKKTLGFISNFDKKECFVDIYMPSDPVNKPLPLVIAPHPITWTSAEDYFGGVSDLKKKEHLGYHGLSDKYQIFIAMPHGHHRKKEYCSLAYDGQMEDMAYIPNLLEKNNFPIDKKRIYCCGLSMGGQESLVFAGRFPSLVAAAVVFNPIVDLAAWYEDSESSTTEEFLEFAAFMNIEVGGSPTENPDAYSKRSPIHYINSLSQVPLLIFWSEKDSLVPRQEEKHSYRLFRAIKEKNCSAPISEFNHTVIHHYVDYSPLERYMIHEWCDYDWALNWLSHFSHN